MAQLPYIISGTVRDASSNTLANVYVYARNERTNENQTVTSDSNGRYSLDATNFTSGYANSDVVTVFVIYTNYEDYVEHTIDTSLGGATVDLTLESVLAADTLRYVTVQDINAYMNLTIGSSNVSDITTNELVLIGTKVEGQVDDFCNRRFDTSNSVTNEYHDSGYLQQDFFLKHIPVQELTTLEVNKIEEGSTAAWTTLTVTTQYELNSTTGRVRILDDDNYPAEGSQQLRATYTHGSTTAPGGIKKLVCLLILRDLMAGTMGGKVAQGRGELSPASLLEHLDKEITALFTRYRIMSISAV